MQNVLRAIILCCVRTHSGATCQRTTPRQSQDDVVIGWATHPSWRTIANELTVRSRQHSRSSLVLTRTQRTGDISGMVLLLQWSREKAVMADILNNIGFGAHKSSANAIIIFPRVNARYLAFVSSRITPELAVAARARLPVTKAT